jgi:serine phosphatase RsbU (regulator of sigma subunit)
MVSSPPIFLIVRDASGEMLRLPFDGQKMIVGRVPQANVRLDHGMVSRQHAEIWRDQQGRFHVRDLQSRNGTLVNGQAVTESALNDGDQIGIGPFTLMVQEPGTVGSGTSTRIVLSEDADARLSSLRDHAPPRIDVAHLTTLNEFSQELLATPGAEDRREALCKVMVGPHFRGQWAVMVRTLRGATETPPQLLAEAYGAMVGREPYLSRSVLRRVRDTGEAVLASNAGLPAHQEEDVQMSISPSVMAMAAVACPVLLAAEHIDLLYMMLPPLLGSAEWLALVNLAVKQYQQAESAWTARQQAEAMAAMERELARARQIQMRLVPKNPAFERLDVAIGFVPCLVVGGDYVDAVAMNDGRTLLAIADVCGKGLSAALIASAVHTMIHAGVLSGLSLPVLMTNLNKYLSQTLSGESFVTMIAIAIDAAAGEIEVVDAGHPPTLVLSPGRPPRRIEVEGNMPLGQEPGPIVSERLALADDEMLALYSDGLSELPDGAGKLLGINGLSAELTAVYTSPQIKVCDAAVELSRRLDALQGSRPSADDRTFLLARRRI